MTFFKSKEAENKKLVLLSIVSALGAVIYIVLVVLFMNNAQKFFGKAEDSLFAPIIMLALFVLSALITGSVILGKPVMLYLDGKKTEGITLLFYTIISLAVIFALVVLIFLGSR